jgi:hypothetical protein
VLPSIARTVGCAITALVAGIIPACGGVIDPVATCGKVQPCGGNIVGDWTLVAACETTTAITPELANDVMGSECPTVTASHVYASISGSLTFNADSTYSSSRQVKVSFDANIPASCSATLSCAMAQANLQAAIDAGAISAGWCAGTPCVCHQVVPENQSETGTYTTAGKTFTTTPMAGTASSADYCIRGSTAHFMNVSMSMSLGAMGRVVIDADMVGEKQ